MDTTDKAVKKDLRDRAYDAYIHSQIRENRAKEEHKKRSREEAKAAVTDAFNRRFPDTDYSAIASLGDAVIITIPAKPQFQLLCVWDGEAKTTFHLFRPCDASSRCGVVEATTDIKDIADLGRRLSEPFPLMPEHRDHAQAHRIIYESPRKAKEKKYVPSQAYMLFYSSALTGGAASLTNGTSFPTADELVKAADAIAKLACMERGLPSREEVESC